MMICCTKSIEIEVREQKPKVKVFSISEFGESINFNLAYTSSITDPYLEYPISDALVNLFYQKQLVEGLKPLGDGQYQSNFNKYLPGDTLSFELIMEEQLISSIAEIPYPINEVSIALDTIPSANPGGGYVFDFSISIPDLVDVSNFYEVELWISVFNRGVATEFSLFEVRSDDPAISQQAYYQPFTFMTGASPISLPFTDQSFDGELRTIKFNYSPPFSFSITNNVTTTSIIEHEIVILIKSISKSYYDFKTSVISHILARESNEIFGSSIPVSVTGNIAGGLGIFACQHSVTDTLKMNKIIIKQ